MGACCSSGDGGRKKIWTLNYCGISYSPFQFYFGDKKQELQKISKIFKQLVKQYVTDFKEDKFKWEMGKIEKTFKLGRYSNMFTLNVGIESKKFINRQQFQELWHSSYQDYLVQTNTKAEGQKQQAQVCLYDFIMYHTLLKFVYGDDSFANLIKKNPSQFQKILAPFYKISFLNEELKVEKFKGSMQLHKPDVLFIQEYSQVLIKHLEAIESYIITIDQKGDSLIALNKTFFKTDTRCNQIVMDLKKKNPWLQKSAITVANGVIFCSIHLTSNEERNKLQVIQLKEGIKVLIDEYKDYNFIVAGDVNSFIEFQSKENINFFPKTKDQLTTLKRRTASQAQYHKAEKEISESKDKIISSFIMENTKITFIDDKPAKGSSYLPTDDHPHDHFLLQAQIYLRKE